MAAGGGGRLISTLENILRQFTSLPELTSEETQKYINDIAANVTRIHGLLVEDSLPALQGEIYTSLEAMKRTGNLIKQKLTSYSPALANSMKSEIDAEITTLRTRIADSDDMDLQRTLRLYAQQSIICRKEAPSERLRLHLNDLAKKLGYLDSRNAFTSKSPRCFISYAWPLGTHPEERLLQPFLSCLRTHLREAGIIASLDLADAPPGDSIHWHMTQAEDSEYVLLINTPSLKEKHESPTHRAVQSELAHIATKHDQDIKHLGTSRVYPALIAGTLGRANPKYLEMYANVRDWHQDGRTYSQKLEEFIGWVYFALVKDSTDETTQRNIQFFRDDWRKFNTEIVELPISEAEIERELSFAYHDSIASLLPIGSLDQHTVSGATSALHSPPSKTRFLLGGLTLSPLSIGLTPLSPGSETSLS